jgi:hypothetical protein
MEKQRWGGGGPEPGARPKVPKVPKEKVLKVLKETYQKSQGSQALTVGVRGAAGTFHVRLHSWPLSLCRIKFV